MSVTNEKGQFVCCYIAVHADLNQGRIGIVKYNETGYYATDWPTMPMDDARQLASEKNAALEIPEDVAESMHIASMVGWDKPIAQRAHEYFKPASDAPMTVIQCLIKHYRDSGNAPYSRKELLSLYGREWLKDSEQVIQFEHMFCVCRDGVVRLR